MKNMDLSKAVKQLTSLTSEYETRGAKYEIIPCEYSDNIEIRIEGTYFITIGNWNFDNWTLCCYAHSIAAACNLIARRESK